MLDLPGRGERPAVHPHREARLNRVGLRRLVWVADRGFASAADRGYLPAVAGTYVHAERLRGANAEAAAALARAGRHHVVAPNLRVKEVTVGPGGTVGAAAAGVRPRGAVHHLPQTPNRPTGASPSGTG